MRIISGSRRGRKLISFEGDSIRPTTDRVKESIFNLIQDFIFDSNVLDLFGGTGALALESLSRGAAHAVIIDKNQKSVSVIRQNIASTDFGDMAEVLLKSAEDYVKTCNRKFDLIFLDPPYNKGFVVPILNSISQVGLLSTDGIVVLESDFGDDHGQIEGLDILKQKKYGRTYITIYRRKI